MRQLALIWVLTLFCNPVLAGPGNSDPQPPGRALGHENAANPHYVVPVEEEELDLSVCPTLSSAPHLCVNYQ